MVNFPVLSQVLEYPFDPSGHVLLYCTTVLSTVLSWSSANLPPNSNSNSAKIAVQLVSQAHRNHLTDHLITSLDTCGTEIAKKNDPEKVFSRAALTALGALGAALEGQEKFLGAARGLPAGFPLAVLRGEIREWAGEKSEGPKKKLFSWEGSLGPLEEGVEKSKGEGGTLGGILGGIALDTGGEDLLEALKVKALEVRPPSLNLSAVFT